MAKIECELQGDFDRILSDFEALMNENRLVSKEGSSDFAQGGCRLAVRVYEQYEAVKDKYAGVNITLAQDDAEIRLSVITTGEGMSAETGIADERILDLIRNTAERYKPYDEWRVTW